MKPGAIFKIFQKGAKEGAKYSGKKGGGAFSWPSGVRIGVYGHANSGKTVYFTVLNEESKYSKELQISVTDNATAGEFLSNYRGIWGLGTAVDSGTMVDRRGEKKFPEQTVGDKVLLFNANVDRKKQYSIVTYDYNGKAVSITDKLDLKEKVIDFFMGCNGILFFFDPKTLAAELQSQEHVASFVSMLERLAPLDSRLPIPIGLVVTKADILPGFTGENQTVLISPEDENFLAEDFELFLDKALSSNRIASNSVWAGTVRNLLIKLREFLKVVVGRTLDFQIFFTSSMGQTPEKIGADVGRSIYAPPAKIQPVGVREPFHWILNAIGRNRKISGFRKVAKVVTLLSLLVIIVYSLPFLYHFKYLLSDALKTEKRTVETARSSGGISQSDSRIIAEAYREYYAAWTVRRLYKDFIPPARQLAGVYEGLVGVSTADQMNGVIKKFTAMVRNPDKWPKRNPANDSVEDSEDSKSFLTEMDGFDFPDTTSALALRKKRVLSYMDIFKESIRKPGDSIFAKMQDLIGYDLGKYSSDLSKDEKDLMGALSEYCTSKKEQKAQIATAQVARSDFDNVMKAINGNPNPAFRIDTAVTQLQALLPGLDPVVDKSNIDKINRYIRDASVWKDKRQDFKCKIISLPPDAHLHIEVTDHNESPKWVKSEQVKIGQLFKDSEVTLRWKVGDDIHVAIDMGGKCDWGQNASDVAAITDKYSLFTMEEGISFDNVGKKAKVSFEPALKDMLPALK